MTFPKHMIVTEKKMILTLNEGFVQQKHLAQGLPNLKKLTILQSNTAPIILYACMIKYILCSFKKKTIKQKQ